jgi:hypothetical protein
MTSAGAGLTMHRTAPIGTLAAVALALALAGCGDNIPALVASTQDGPGAGGAGAPDGGGGEEAGSGGRRDDGEDAGEAEAGDDVDGSAGDAVGDGAGQVLPGSLGPHCAGCTRTAIGHPTWEPKGGVVLVGTVGSADGGASDLVAWIGGLCQPNHRFFQKEFTIGPALAHFGPYDDEAFALAIADGLEPTQVLSTAAYTAPSGVVLVINLVPSEIAPTGSSFDFDSGPIIPNSRFPIRVHGSLLRDGAPQEFFDSFYPGYDQFTPAIDKDGSSHLFIFLADNSSFVPGLPAAGSYEFLIRATEEGGAGAGWDIVVPYSVGD